MSNQDFISTLLRKNSLRKAAQELSLTEIEKAIADLEEIKASRLEDEEARAAAEAERLDAIRKIQEQMAELGISTEDIVQATGGSVGQRPKVEAKYRLTDEEGNVHEWSGRGRTPRVFQEQIDQGASKEDFRI